jgi:hypothetical protein
MNAHEKKNYLSYPNVFLQTGAGDEGVFEAEIVDGPLLVG